MTTIDLKKENENNKKEEGLELKLIFSWKKKKESYKSFLWQFIIGLVAVLSAFYFFWQKNFFGAIAIIMGFLAVILLQRGSDNKEVECSIFNQGIKIKESFFPWRNIRGFGIVEEIEELVILTKGKLVQRVAVPVRKEDSLKIKKILKNYIPEKNIELTLSDIFRKKLGID